jgi:hypothetical protein
MGETHAFLMNMIKDLLLFLLFSSSSMISRFTEIGL